MNLSREVNKEKTAIALEHPELLDKNKDCVVRQDPIRLLYFSKDCKSNQFIFDSISCQCDSTWHSYQSNTFNETSILLIQQEINLILIYYDVLQVDELNSIAKLARQMNIPILALIDAESRVIASTALCLGAQDYITIEELQDSKIFRRVILHTMICYYSKIQDNITPSIIDIRIGDHQNIEDSRKTEERFYLLSEHVPIGIFQLDLLGDSVYTNTYLQNICCQNSEKVHRESWIEELHPEDRAYLENIGALDSEKKSDQSWMEFIHPDDLQRVLQSFEDFIQGVCLLDCEFRLIRSQSDIRWVLGQGNTLTQSSGELTGYIGTIVDITDRKHAEENLKQLNFELENRVFERTSALQQINLQLRIGNKIREFHETERLRAEKELSLANDQLQAVLDAVPGCVAWVSANLSYLGVNQAMAKTFQINTVDFIGKEVGFIKSDTKDYVNFIKEFFSGSQENSSKELIFEFNNEERFYLLIGQKYAQGKSAVFVAIEITERKRAEIETQKALEKVKELSDLKSRFIFMVSHEFRTPLTSIFSASELLEHYGNKWSAEKKLNYLKQIQESVQRMNGLLEDVLIIGAGEVGKLKIQPTELKIVDFCQQLIEEIQLSKSNHHVIHFKYVTQLQNIMIDGKLLRHILSNLLSNAIKYSPAENPINFDLFGDNEAIIFQITDCGIGVPLEEQKHLFDLFHRASNVGTIGGTGIGLSIVKKSVDALDGSISFQSDIHTGSKFTVSIPITQIKEDYQW
jgi:signal transduction histidine kinase